MKENCLFCQIAQGTLPSRRLHETANTLFFLDQAADVDYHVLAIPKKHRASLLECESPLVEALFRDIQRFTEQLITVGEFAGFNLLHASGAAAGQSVGHCHVHLILRKAGDSYDLWPTLNGTTQSLESCASEIQRLLA